MFDAIVRVANNNFTTYHDNNDVLNQHKFAHGNSSSNVNFNVDKCDPVCDMEVDESDTESAAESEPGVLGWTVKFLFRKFWCMPLCNGDISCSHSVNLGSTPKRRMKPI